MTEPRPDSTWREAFEAVPDAVGQTQLFAPELGLAGELAKDRAEAEAAVTEAARRALEHRV
jgi:hypothetical protein